MLQRMQSEIRELLSFRVSEHRKHAALVAKFIRGSHRFTLKIHDLKLLLALVSTFQTCPKPRCLTANTP